MKNTDNNPIQKLYSLSPLLKQPCDIILYRAGDETDKCFLSLNKYLFETYDFYDDFHVVRTAIIRYTDSYFYVIRGFDKRYYLFEDTNFPYDSESIKHLGIIESGSPLYDVFSQYMGDIIQTFSW